jgi:hypothetical protein
MKRKWFAREAIAMQQPVRPYFGTLLFCFAGVLWMVGGWLMVLGFTEQPVRNVVALVPLLFCFALVATDLAIDYAGRTRGDELKADGVHVATVRAMMTPWVYSTIIVTGALVGTILAVVGSVGDSRTGFAVGASVLGALWLRQGWGLWVALKNAQLASGDLLRKVVPPKPGAFAQFLWKPARAVVGADKLCWEVSAIEVTHKGINREDGGREVRKTLWSSGIQKTEQREQVEMAFEVPEDLLPAVSADPTQVIWEVWVAPMRKGRSLYEVLREI